MSADEATRDERFSLVVGGPFHSLLRRLGLTGEDQLPRRSAAILLAALAWLPLALLVLVEHGLDRGYPVRAFFTDWTVYARYLIAVGVLVATERYAEGRIVLLTRQFRDARLLSDDAVPGFLAALALADRRSRSALAEGVVLAAALVWSTAVERYVVASAGSTWEGAVVDGAVALSWAGQAARFVSNPLFLFLVLRWLWRFCVWTALLFRISRLPLQLTPLHPDRAAGLGFLAIYPSIFNGLAFALGCVVASSILKEIGLHRHETQTIWLLLGAWLALSGAIFLGPLLVFAGPLYRVRERALLEYGRLASQHHLAFHRKWVGAGRSGEELMGSADPSSASDLNASVDVVQELRVVPIDRAAILQLLLAAGLPLLAVVASQVPLAELLVSIAGAIL